MCHDVLWQLRYMFFCLHTSHLTLASGLLMLPVSKNSVLQLLLGVSYTGAMSFHKSMGWFFVIVSVLHVCAYIKSATSDSGKHSSRMIPDISQLPWGKSHIVTSHRSASSHTAVLRYMLGAAQCSGVWCGTSANRIEAVRLLSSKYEVALTDLLASFTSMSLLVEC